MRRILLLTPFLLLFLSEHAQALVINVGLDFNRSGGVNTVTEVPFFNGDHTGALLDRGDADPTNDRLDFEFLVRDKLPSGFVIQNVELFIDARNLSNAMGESARLRLTSPGEVLGDLNVLNRTPTFVPLITGGQTLSDPILGPDTDDKDNTFFTIPDTRYIDIQSAIISFRLIARGTTRFRADGANLQVTGFVNNPAAIPEPSTVLLMTLVGCAGLIRKFF